MNTEALTIPLALLFTVVAVLLGALPAVTRPTVPLGVSVPASRLEEPVIRQAIGRFRLLIAIAWVVCVALLVVLGQTAAAPAELLCVFLFIIAQLASYVIARRMIVRAKRDGGWYEGVPVRVAGSVTAPAEPAPVPTGWGVASVVLLAVAYAVGILLYPSLPGRLPTHWGFDGQPDVYADKNAWTVFGPLFIGTVVVAGLFALSFLGRVVPIRALPGADAATNARRQHDMRSAMSSLIGRLMFLISLEFAWATVGPRLFPELARTSAAGAIVVVALMFVIIVLFIVRWRRLMVGDARLVAAERAAHGTVDTPDDDRFWKAGLLYVNRDDPALFVQRRFGVGWTVNLGHPAGVVIGVIVALVIVGVVTFALTHAAMRV
ncbi:MAG TPA: DUF5808 domain-containing protein [Microbacterium sp.]|uniref:DUF1648 domain-containing protein n=1 Tax=Microbacterium sp. TaxID=51671 RepID=UPI002B481FFA|nr:DUF5808 domain-containing protein [Microbacterium sp.]HKT56823.1 DUF5808 domain-containing protein [Microbacterium sp.]